MTADPNLTSTTDPEAECKHMVLHRSTIINRVMWRCQEPACQKLFSLVPFKTSVIPSRV